MCLLHAPLEVSKFTRMLCQLHLAPYTAVLHVDVETTNLREAQRGGGRVVLMFHVP